MLGAMETVGISSYVPSRSEREHRVERRAAHGNNTITIAIKIMTIGTCRIVIVTAIIIMQQFNRQKMHRRRRRHHHHHATIKSSSNHHRHSIATITSSSYRRHF